MPLMRRGEYSRAWLGPCDVWRIFYGARRCALNETRPGQDATRRKHRGRGWRSNAPGARRRTVALERSGFRERGAPRRLFGATPARWHDRTGAYFRIAKWVLEITGCVARQ